MNEWIMSEPTLQNYFVTSIHQVYPLFLSYMDYNETSNTKERILPSTFDN